MNTSSTVLPEQTTLESPPAKANSSRLNGSYLAVLAFMGLAIAELLLYEHYFQKRVAPYYPVSIDQVVTYLFGYWAHFQIVENGLVNTLSDPFFWHWSDPMKGPGLNFLATIGTFVLGPERFSIGVLNLVFLVIGQGALFFYLKKRNGLGCALLASGLFLFLGSHYLGVGGINDMRRDYGCMILSGLTFFAALSWLETGRQKDFGWAFFALVCSSVLRSVALFYWTGAFFISSAFLLICMRFSSGANSIANLLKRTLLMFAASVFVVSANVLLNLHDFWTYYLSHKVDGEEVMRWKEFGVHNLVERFLYYPQSFMTHFGFVLSVASAMVLVLLVARLVTRKFGGSLDKQSWSRHSVGISIMLFASLTISAVAILTFYSPNPIVIGFLGMILCVCLARVVQCLQENVVPSRVFVVCAALMALAGFNHFRQELRAPEMRPHGDLIAADTVNDALNRIKTMVEQRGSLNTTIYWALVHDGLNDRNFDVFWYEEARKSKPKSLRHLLVPYFPATDWKAASVQLSTSDIVVIPTWMAPLPDGGFEYEGNASVRKLLPQIEPVLANEFVLVEKYKLPSLRWDVGIFQRKGNPR